MSEVQRFGSIGKLVKADRRLLELYPSMTVYTLASDYDALAAQRDEGLAREVELKDRNYHLDKRLREEQTYVSELAAENTILQKRLAEAIVLIDRALLLIGEPNYSWMADAGVFMASDSPGCADGEKS